MPAILVMIIVAAGLKLAESMYYAVYNVNGLNTTVPMAVIAVSVMLIPVFAKKWRMKLRKKDTSVGGTNIGAFLIFTLFGVLGVEALSLCKDIKKAVVIMTTEMMPTQVAADFQPNLLSDIHYPLIVIAILLWLVLQCPAAAPSKK